MSRALAGALGIAGIAVAVALTPIVQAAVAADASPSQVRALASQAATGNAGALAQLRSVSSIDGQPANLNAAISPGSAEQLRSRLLVLAGSATDSGPSSAADARAAAASILAARRFQGALVTDPIQRGFQKLGRWIESLAASVPGGPPVFWIVLAVIVLVAAVAGTRRMMRRLGTPDLARAKQRGEAREDPAALERAADDAESRGAFAESVRLRFRAGLLRLSSIEYRASLLTGEVARRLHSRQFEVLAASFDRIAYGGAAAGPADAKAAREGWQRVLAEARGR